MVGCDLEREGRREVAWDVYVQGFLALQIEIHVVSIVTIVVVQYVKWHVVLE